MCPVLCIKNFGAVPKFFGIKITEDYTAAPFDSQQAFQVKIAPKMVFLFS